MNYQVHTTEGFQITINDGPEPADFTAQLNNRGLHALSLADMVIAKGTFRVVVGANDGTGTHEVHTMDGGIFLTNIVEYNPTAITATINDVNNEFIQVGNVIVQRHNFKMVRAAATNTN